MSDREQRVVILYANSLLGEGLGRILAADRSLSVELVHVDDAATAERALADPPDVVILERGLPRQALDLLRLVPSALFIDVGLDAGPTWTYCREELSPHPEDLLRAINLRSAHAADADAPVREDGPKTPSVSGART
ncbi:MAG: hypothetical protein ACHQNA_13590 [Acidimicrobiales bacterium]